MAAPTNNIICVVPKLKGCEDYHYWPVQMETHLKASNLSRFVEERIGEDVAVDPATQREDSVALSQIHQSIDMSIFWRISAARNAKEAWDILERTFGGVHHVHEFGLDSLKKKFERVAMEKHEPIESYFSRLAEIKADLDIYGYSIADGVFVEKVLNSLRPEYHHLVTVIQETKDLSALTPGELLVSLQVHEQRIKERVRDVGRSECRTGFVALGIGFLFGVLLTGGNRH